MKKNSLLKNWSNKSLIKETILTLQIIEDEDEDEDEDEKFHLHQSHHTFKITYWSLKIVN